MGVRSVDYREFVNGLFVNRCRGNEGLAHAAIGMAGEAGELLDALKKHWVYGKPLDVTNVVEEIGDFYWYAQAYYIAADLGELPDLSEKEVSWIGGGMIVNALARAAAAAMWASSACDRVVTRLALDREGPFFSGYHLYVSGAIREIDNLCQIFGLTRELVLNANVEKLLKRYPGGYTNAAAIERADKRPFATEEEFDEARADDLVGRAP